MDEEKNLNEELQERPRRRRRSEMYADAADSTAEKPAVRTADSRIPAEARRMAASPYGSENAPAVRRPGTRPVQAVRRPVQESRRIPPEPRRTIAPVRPDGNIPDGEETDSTRSFDATRISVGYAPGQMGQSPKSARDIRNAAEYRGEAYGREIYSREAHVRDPRDPRNIPNMQDGRYGVRLPGDRELPAGKKHPVLWAVTAVLLVAGLATVILLSMPKDSDLRKQASETVGKLTAPLENALEKKNGESNGIETFIVTGNETVTAPADVIFAVTADSSVKNVRLVDEDGAELAAEATSVENTDNNCWNLTFRVRDGYEGLVRLQAQPEDGEWKDTDRSVVLAIAPPLAGTETSGTEEIPADGDPEGSGESAGPESGTADGEISGYLRKRKRSRPRNRRRNRRRNRPRNRRRSPRR